MTENPSNPTEAITETDRLAELLSPATDQMARRQWYSEVRGVVLGIVVVAILPAGVYLTQGWPSVERAILFIGWAVVLLLTLAPSAPAFPLLRTIRSGDTTTESDVLRALGEARDPRSIGQLIDAEAATTGDRQAAIQAALARLLPRAGELENLRLSDEQLARLCTHLDAFSKLHSYTAYQSTFNAYPLGGTWERTKIITEEFPELRDEYIAFLLAILSGLEVAGDEESVRHVEALFGDEPRSQQVERIQTAAWNCFNAIHDRLEAKRLGRTLLRPTLGPADPLLRPAVDPGRAAPESLLRLGESAGKGDEPHLRPPGVGD